ncbi:GAF domain-containing protein [Streptomyces zagrosensis]|nr:GAF domain-containing protein [Streptomyces zagrosensis]
MPPGTDPADRSRAVRVGWEEFLARGSVTPSVRPVVAESWRRSAQARVARDGVAPIALAAGDLETYRSSHPLARVLPLFRDLLGGVAHDGAHLFAVCDELGRMLWVEGHRGVLRRAEDMNFVAGARWDERYAGTNAPGTALTVGHPVQIFATEHFSRQVQPWTCAAAPVRDPHTGRLLGAIDITGGDHLAGPHSLALVQATARAAEAELAALERPTTGPGAWVSALGRDEALLVAEGRRLRLSRRHSEIMVLLACHPDGLTGDRLALLLYGERSVDPVTLRAELSRLRRRVGPLLGSRPYRLCASVRCDVLTAADELAAGRPHAALQTYQGPLLPLSEAPGIRRLRAVLDDRVRRAVLSSHDVELLRRWAETPWGEGDLEAREALLAALPAHSPDRASVARGARRLRTAYGLTAHAPAVDGGPRAQPPRNMPGPSLRPAPPVPGAGGT